MPKATRDFQTPAARIFLPLIFLPNSGWGLQAMKRGTRGAAKQGKLTRECEQRNKTHRWGKGGNRFQGLARRRTATGRQECLRSLGECIWQVAALGLAPPRDFAASRRKWPAIILPVIMLPWPWARGEGGKMMEGKTIPEAGRGVAAVRAFF